MGERTATAPRDAGHTADGVVEIGRGAHGVISLDRSTETVIKQFQMADDIDSASLAQQEFDYLFRFAEALDAERYLSCPRPLRIDQRSGTVWMSLCPGIPLESQLASEIGDIDAHLPHIADQICIATERYIETFDEPYYDLALKNMLYDVPTKTLSFVDFSSRRRERHPAPPEAALDITLACLIGLSTYELVRPVNWSNTRYRDRQGALLAGVIRRLKERHPVRPREIRRVSREIYNHSGKSGGVKRWLWYSTIGDLLYWRRVASIMSACDFDS